MAQELINYGRKYGPIPSNTTDSRSIRRTECKTLSPAKLQKVRFSPGLGRQTNTGEERKEKRNALWIAGLQKGVPRTLMDGQPTNKLELFIQEWPAKEEPLKAVPATAPPLEEPQEREGDRKPLSLQKVSQGAKGGFTSGAFLTIPEETR